MTNGYLMNLPEKTSDRLKLLVASAMGLGLSPVVPGTCGTLLGVIIHLAIVWIFPAAMVLPALVFAFIAVSAANHLLTPWAETYWQTEDPGHFVLDEVAGYLFIPVLFRDSYNFV